jgi:four helix bundle protein
MKAPGGIASYRDLLVWQRAMNLTVLVYRATQYLPAEEAYGLRNQARRAAVSVPANIAEGKGRWHAKEFLHSLSMARASLQELETHLELTIRLGYNRRENLEPILQEADEVGRMLTGLAKAIRART